MTNEEVITDVLRTWGLEFAISRELAIRGQDLVAKGELLQSVRHEITGELQRIQRFSFAMNESGRILDMQPRSLDWSKLPPIEKIEAWVVAVGVSKFRNAGLRGPGGVATQLANSIAWGIGKSMLKRGRFKTRRPWYNKPVFTDISSMYGRMLAAIRENTADNLVEQLGGSSNKS